MNEEYENDETLRRMTTELYRYMIERKIGKVVIEFSSGNEFECCIKEKVVLPSLSEILGKEDEQR